MKILILITVFIFSTFAHADESYHCELTYHNKSLNELETEEIELPRVPHYSENYILGDFNIILWTQTYKDIVLLKFLASRNGSDDLPPVQAMTGSLLKPDTPPSLKMTLFYPGSKNDEVIDLKCQ